MHDVVFLLHTACRVVRTLQQREPAAGGVIREIRAAVAAHPFDREPLERRPAVRRVPLLAGRNGGGDETTGLEKLALQAGGDVPALIGRRDSEVERCRRRQRRTVADFFAGSPAHVPEEILLVHREDGLAPLLRQLGEAAGDFRVTGRVAERAQCRDRALGVVQKTVEIDGDQFRRLQRAQILWIAHPATRKVPAALGSRARRAIEVRAL